MSRRLIEVVFTVFARCRGFPNTELRLAAGTQLLQGLFWFSAINGQRPMSTANARVRRPPHF